MCTPPKTCAVRKENDYGQLCSQLLLHSRPEQGAFWAAGYQVHLLPLFYRLQGKNWLELAKKEGKKDSRGNWTGFNDLAGILWGIGVFVVLICGTILGIKYMFSSLEERANIKESIKPYIIGTAIILGALSIWKFLVEFLDSI